MPQTFNLGNALEAGDRITANAQNREFNSLRATGERQRQDLQRRTFDADTQRANSEKLLAGFAIMRENPNITPRVLDELGNNGIINPGAIPQMLAEAQNSPQTFQQKMLDAESQIKLSLGQGPPTREDRKILTGADKLNRFVDTGEQVFEGVEAPTGVAAAGAAERFFGSLTADLSAEQQADAKLIQLGLQARAGSSAQERIAGDEDLTESVAESQARIEGAKSFAKATGASRSKFIDKGFEQIQALDTNIRNLDKALGALDEGATTGVIESKFFPTFRKATLKLEQLQKELGLDVIGGVTFGALSKGELDLALDVALPVGLQPDELREWIVTKSTAQEKLRAYFAEQVDFLDQGGTIAGFVRQQERGGQQGAESGNVIDFRDLPP